MVPNSAKIALRCVHVGKVHRRDPSSEMVVQGTPVSGLALNEYIIRPASSSALRRNTASRDSSNAESSPPMIRITVSNIEMPTARLKLSLVATHSLASSNSALSPKIHRLSRQSIIVAPRCSQSCDLLLIGLISSMPHACFRYAPHARLNAPRTASSRTRASASDAFTSASVPRRNVRGGSQGSGQPALAGAAAAAAAATSALGGT
mmetsp:Transcript_8209/g.23761  ORF Transcript_8209/g.23761 Transcript_8209/m.23761 type:complete len:206 (-) Transcript_8209:1147-1764(-)